MTDNNWQEPLVEKLVTYTLELDGKIVVIENVPAKVNEETGEQLFLIDTLEKLQSLILDGLEP
ncbi:MAG: YgiT-type zinc finger protein [Phormidesmis sp.]